MLPSPLSPEFESQSGKRRDGLRHLNCVSRLIIRFVSSQVLSRGPTVEGIGEGSRRVRCIFPGFVSGVEVEVGKAGDEELEGNEVEGEEEVRHR